LVPGVDARAACFTKTADGFFPAVCRMLITLCLVVAASAPSPSSSFSITFTPPLPLELISFVTALEHSCGVHVEDLGRYYSMVPGTAPRFGGVHCPRCVGGVALPPLR
jgi:hypothetical protein